MIVDVNVNLSRWPFRRLPHDETPRLVEKLEQMHVEQAWVGSFDGLLHKDIAGVNTRLVDDCRRYGKGILVPFGSVNPTLPAWKDDLHRCHEVHSMRGIRLHPNYHGYGLDDPAFVELLDKAAQNGLIVQIAIMMEDERTQHSLVQVPPVDATPLLKLLRERKSLKELRLVILNGQRALRGEALSNLADAGNVYFDFAMQEGVGGLEKLSKHVPIDRILFGSYSPFFYFESAELKLRESRLGGLANQSLTTKNAEKLLKQ
ncbi:MAG: amidohydrolase family protein [Planctomycetes bacterium]|nr:amidohydrolase family protein [Planctomycetota bacterium]